MQKLIESVARKAFYTDDDILVVHKKSKCLFHKHDQQLSSWKCVFARRKKSPVLPCNVPCITRQHFVNERYSMNVTFRVTLIGRTCSSCVPSWFQCHPSASATFWKKCPRQSIRIIVCPKRVHHFYPKKRSNIFLHSEDRYRQKRLTSPVILNYGSVRYEVGLILMTSSPNIFLSVMKSKFSFCPMSSFQ